MRSAPHWVTLEDMAQEAAIALLDAARRDDGYKGDTPWMAFSSLIIRHRIMTYLDHEWRKGGKQVIYDDKLLSRMRAPDLMTSILGREQLRAVSEAMSRLPKRQRIAIMYGGMYGELGPVLNARLGLKGRYAGKNVLKRARARIRALVG
jgi:DNA-directed RNA polymerase specialized sigma24 family protein